jgi:hypothetical protein
MSDFDPDSPSENEWEESGELAWNEFDWERYLREQDESVHRYLGFYESAVASATRIDDVAEHMGWDRADSEAGEERDSADEPTVADEVYTLQKNPVYISTKALYLSLRRSWELLAGDAGKVPQPLALGLLVSLHRGEEQAVMAIHALDFGDFAMAISLFKRALAALNESFALLGSPGARRHPAVAAYAEQARIRLFDLREIWLRVTEDCRQEIERPLDDES